MARGQHRPERRPGPRHHRRAGDRRRAGGKGGLRGRPAAACRSSATGGCWCTRGSMAAAGSGRSRPSATFPPARGRIGRSSCGWWSPADSRRCHGMAAASPGCAAAQRCPWRAAGKPARRRNPGLPARPRPGGACLARPSAHLDRPGPAAGPVIPGCRSWPGLGRAARSTPTGRGRQGLVSGRGLPLRPPPRPAAGTGRAGHVPVRHPDGVLRPLRQRLQRADAGRGRAQPGRERLPGRRAWVVPLGGTGFLEVRQSDAHAWSEVWLAGGRLAGGWTPAAGLRGSPGTETTAAEAGARGRRTCWQWLQRQWWGLDVAWSRWWLGFDQRRPGSAAGPPVRRAAGLAGRGGAAGVGGGPGPRRGAAAAQLHPGRPPGLAEPRSDGAASGAAHPRHHAATRRGPERSLHQGGRAGARTCVPCFRPWRSSTPCCASPLFPRKAGGRSEPGSCGSWPCGS